MKVPCPACSTDTPDHKRSKGRAPLEARPAAFPDQPVSDRASTVGVFLIVNRRHMQEHTIMTTQPVLNATVRDRGGKGAFDYFSGIDQDSSEPEAHAC